MAKVTNNWKTNLGSTPPKKCAFQPPTNVPDQTEGI